MKEHEDKLWIAPFRDVTKYIRERMAAKVNSKQNDDQIIVKLEHTLDKSLYDYPLTLKTYVPDDWNDDWNEITIRQGDKTLNIKSGTDDKGTYVLYPATPNGDDVVLRQITHADLE